MKKDQVVRDFKLADAVLKQKADEFIVLIDRDITEFTDRGYNDAKRIEFETARDTVVIKQTLSKMERVFIII